MRSLQTDFISGVHYPVPYAELSKESQIYRDVYNMVPDAPLYHTEFGFYSYDAWMKQGGLPVDMKAEELHWRMDEFGLHRYERAGHGLCDLGWEVSELIPRFDERVIEDQGDKEVRQDGAGRHVLFFKGRTDGYMPEYIDHPVKDMKTWEEDVRWRLDPTSHERYANHHVEMMAVQQKAREGKFITQCIIGGYMYLRSLIGPEELLYMFYDEPELLHACMQQWLLLADRTTAKNQEYVTFDEVYFGEDICYNHGSLISEDMIKEFLFPYYQQLLTNIQSRQLDPNRKLFIQLDSDGYVDPIIDLYKEGIGMNVCSPFEVASGSDVVRTAQEHPDLVISGGIDKRILASTPNRIDRELERIIPVLKKRGGYIPTCDHGVPPEVPLSNYLHYRKRMLEFSK